MKPAVAIALVVSLAACERAEAPPRPVPQPPALIAEVALPTLDSSLAGVKQFANAIQPGIGAFINERNLLNMAGLGNLEGSAGDKPAYLLVVEPRAHAKPLAALVAVNDAAKLKDNATKAGLDVRESKGRAVVGDKAVVALLADWAFATLPQRPAPTAVVATAHSAALLAAYRADIEQAGATITAQMQAQGAGPTATTIGDFYSRGGIVTLENSERLEVRVDASASDASLAFRVVPRAGTTFAGFIAAQTPSPFALLDKMPAGSAKAVIAGTIHLGPLREPAVQLLADMVASMYATTVTPEMRAAMLALTENFTGEMAATADLGAAGLSMTQLLGVDDAEQLKATMAAFLTSYGGKTLETTNLGATTRVQLDKAQVDIDGVGFVRYASQVDVKVSNPGAAAAQKTLGSSFVGLLGAWDSVAGLSFGDGDPAKARALIGASRGTAPRLELPARVAADLAAARARKDSLLYFIDIGSFMAAALPGVSLPGSLGMTMTAGFPGGAGELRIAMKSDELKAMIAAVSAAQARPPTP